MCKLRGTARKKKTALVRNCSRLSLKAWQSKSGHNHLLVRVIDIYQAVSGMKVKSLIGRAPFSASCR